MTLYDVLGLKADADDNAIRAAFRRLTLKYHPDRFPKDQRREAEERFQQITEAFNVLSRPEARDAYDRKLSASRAANDLDPSEIARKFAAKGAQEYKSGNIVRAREDLELAIHHDDSNSRAHYFLGLTLLRLPGQQRTGLRHLDRAVTLEPENTVIKAEAARYFFSAGMRFRAKRLAQETIEKDPTNRRAAEVLEKIGE